MSTITMPRLTVVAAAGAALMLLAGCASGSGEATALTAPNTQVAAMCAELTPETMADADTAFRGTVTAIDGGQVTLRVDEEYEGDLEDFVTVPQQEDQPSELSAGAFVEGDEYLISAIDGVITTCGQSGPATPELAELYDAAF